MSSIFRAARSKLFTNNFYNYVPNNFGKINFVRFFSSNVKSTSATLDGKKFTPKLPDKIQNEKLGSGYFVPGQNEPGYAKWEADVMKGIEELDAYNKMMGKLQEPSKKA